MLNKRCMGILFLFYLYSIVKVLDALHNLNTLYIMPEKKKNKFYRISTLLYSIIKKFDTIINFWGGNPNFLNLRA